jgi:hypothetical protein
MIYCTADTNATRLLVEGVHVDFEIDMDFTSLERCEACSNPPIHWEPGALSLGENAPGVKLTSPPSSAEVKEEVEFSPHSPNSPSWRGVQLKYGDKFNFYLHILYMHIHTQGRDILLCS